jgi:hypothetical protein
LATRQPHFQQDDMRRRVKHHSVHGTARDRNGGLRPSIGHPCHPCISLAYAALAQQHVVELRVVRAADHVNGDDAPTVVQTVADAGIDEEEVVVEMGDDSDKRAGAATGRQRGR